MRRLLALPVLAGLLITGCGSSSSPSSTPIPKTVHVSIVENKASKHPDAFYRPSPIKVYVGQTVIWTNYDGDPHDITFDDGSFYSGPIPASGSYPWRAATPGRYPYFCTLHPDMHGVIVIQKRP